MESRARTKPQNSRLAGGHWPGIAPRKTRIRRCLKCFRRGNRERLFKPSELFGRSSCHDAAWETAHRPSKGAGAVSQLEPDAHFVGVRACFESRGTREF